MPMLESLGLRAIQVLFAVAALTPLWLVLLFRVRRVEARRIQLCEIMKRAFGDAVKPGDPPPATKEEAERRNARSQLDKNPFITNFADTFEACHSWKRYSFPLLSLGILTVAICTVLYVWVRAHMAGAAPAGPVGSLPLPVVMALVGGHVWTLYQIVVRVRSEELEPGDLIELSLGLISCVPIGIAFSFITLDAGNLPAFAAFAISAFPIRETQRFVQEQLMKRAFTIDLPARTQRPAERPLGTAIDGLSDHTLVRLAELRISTVLDMAYADPISVMVQTGYPLPLIVDWIDQSILALYTGDKKAELTRMGLRCSLDVYEFVEVHSLWLPKLTDPEGGKRGTPTGSDFDVLKIVADTLGTDPRLVHDFFLRIYADPQVAVLRRLWYINGAPAPVTVPVAQTA